MSKRPETGPMQFGNDWTGVFIRGDNAGYLAMILRNVLDGDNSPIARADMEGLAETLAASNERGQNKAEVQKLRPWAECQPEPDATS